MLEVEGAGLSDPGPYRETNEDAIGSFVPEDPMLLERKGVLYAIADGLGGHQAGEVASSTAVATVIEEYYAPSSHSRIEPALRNALQAANLRVHDLALRHAEYRSMGTTFTAIALAGAQAYIAHVGDTRVYHWREGRFTQLTSDHSEVAELVRMRVVKPERARDHPARNALTRTVGHKLILRPDFLRQPLQPGDQFLLCCDGVWSEIEDGEMSQVLGDCAPTDACRAVIDMALARDCQDNISVQVIKVLEVGPEPETSSSRGWLPGIFRGRRG